MLQLIYISSVVGNCDSQVCEKILKTARDHNSKHDITGLLLFNSKRFLQVLEGPDPQVEDLFERISRDPRHRAIVTLSSKTVEDREFGAWAMAYDGNPDSPSSNLKCLVDGLLDRAGPSTAALFRTTAELHRPR